MLVIHAGEGSVVGPTQFVTQCVTNWKGQVELTHVLEVCNGEALPEVFRKSLRELFHDVSAYLAT